MEPWQRFSFSRIKSSRDGTVKPLTPLELSLLLKATVTAVACVRVTHRTTGTSLKLPVRKRIKEKLYCHLVSRLIRRLQKVLQTWAFYREPNCY